MPLPDIGGVGFGSSPKLDTKHTIYEFCLPSERGCVAMSCGGGFCSPDCAYDSVWDSVLHMTEILHQLFLVPRGRGCVCMLNGWFSSNDTICADNYIYFRFKLQVCVAVRSGSCICTAILSSWWTVIVWKCCPGVCLRLGSSPYLATYHTPSMCCACLLSVAWV